MFEQAELSGPSDCHRRLASPSLTSHCRHQPPSELVQQRFTLKECHALLAL